MTVTITFLNNNLIICIWLDWIREFFIYSLVIVSELQIHFINREIAKIFKIDGFILVLITKLLSKFKGIQIFSIFLSLLYFIVYIFSKRRHLPTFSSTANASSLSARARASSIIKNNRTLRKIGNVSFFFKKYLYKCVDSIWNQK